MAKPKNTQEDTVSSITKKLAEEKRGNLQGWYSNGLTYEDAAGLEHLYAMITDASYGLEYKILGGAPKLRLTLDLRYEDGCNGTGSIYSQDDILNLLVLTKSQTISDLEGKVVDTMLKGMPDGYTELQGISVNENLIPEYCNKEDSFE